MVTVDPRQRRVCRCLGEDYHIPSLAHRLEDVLSLSVHFRRQRKVALVAPRDEPESTVIGANIPELPRNNRQAVVDLSLADNIMLVRIPARPR